MSLLNSVNFTDEKYLPRKKIKMIVEMAMSRMNDHLNCK